MLRTISLITALGLSSQTLAKDVVTCDKNQNHLKQIQNQVTNHFSTLNSLTNQNLSLSSNPAHCGLPGDESAPQCTHGCKDAISENQMHALRPMLAEKAHREWHFGWHYIRNDGGNEFHELDPALYSPKVGWAYPKGEKTYYFKAKGEDFLYMHRYMIKMVQKKLIEAKQPCITAWEDIPLNSQGDTPKRLRAWPIPLGSYAYGNSELANKQLKKLRDQFAEYKKTSHLRKVSLDELGNQLSGELHGSVHILYTGNSDCTGLWDTSPKCDDFYNTYSSPVNPIFWKFHGMLDEVIGDWLTANGYDYISETCPPGSEKPHSIWEKFTQWASRHNNSPRRCYAWKGTWIGKLPH